MKKFRILFALLAMLVVCPFPGAAETQTQPNIDMPEITVTATRIPIPVSEAAANIAVITQNDIRRMPATTVAEVLQYVPGVFIDTNAGLRGEAVPRIQGSETRHVAVFKDGVPLNQVAYPRTDLSNINIDTVDRIEIYKGAASSAWGSALGGVINIITKEPGPKPVSANLRTSYGEFDTTKSAATFSGTLDKLGYLFSVAQDRSHDFVEHTNFKQDSLYGKLDYSLTGIGRFNFVSSYDRDRNANPLVGWTIWDDEFRQRNYQRLLFESIPINGVTLSVEGRHHRFHTLINDIQKATGLWDYTWTDYFDETWGGSARINYQMPKKNNFLIGFDEDREKYESPTSDVGATTLRKWAVYANDSLFLGNFVLNAGLRYDNSSDFGSQVSPAFGVVYNLPEINGLLKAQVSRGYAAPDPNAVHNTQYGNPNLKAEIGTSYEIGGSINPVKFLTLDVNLFRADVKNLIAYEEIVFGSNVWRPINIDKVRRQGVEGSITANFDFGLILTGSAMFIDIENRNTRETIKDNPRTLFNVSAVYKYAWMTHSLLGRYIDNNSSYPETHDNLFIFDYLINVRLPAIKCVTPTIFGAVHNLFNSNYLYRSVFPQPGRWVEAGIRLEM